ncbi:unnamed protein product (macronuclear) [Paramecium tetraurelia]|uniref:Transmembrane protein n=1 Tax=Paramecium tetraurelia TaxID=5888 RepID=A0E982_PARTE|nr:uncharacterized protein GSPATT00024580001 [Paramecium tetraurelia]CAK91849.1 unnamed protein product [Paramecium tetraurelia]|eukprot:XP_001459246.1 hypothetical protein (macronuclear) [Paramecium tetraurelia strain d4-2]
MLKSVIKTFRFSLFNTKIQQVQKHKYGPLQEKDFKLLNIRQTTSLREIYYSYMKHMKLYEIQQLEEKMELIKRAYLRILSKRLNNIDELTEEESKDLRFLMDNNFGFPFVEGLRRSEMIVEFQEEIEAKKLYHYPRITIALLWLILGIPSFYFSDNYVYEK